MKYDSEIEYYTAHRKSRNRLYIIGFFSLVFFILGILFLIMPYEISNITLFGQRTVILLGVIMLIVGMGVFLFVYLNSRPYFNFISRRYDDYDDIDLNTYFNRNLRKNLVEKYGSGYEYKEEDKSKPKLFEADLAAFKNKFVEQSLHDLEFANLFEELYKSDVKIKLQIERLENNSNLNLIIGIITTSIAIIILGASIFYQKNFLTNLDLLSHYIPRISTVIFVEIFSFFFLKLYKNNLAEIKYFQNEMTNLNFKIAALKTALKTKDVNTITEITKTFSIAERNFILKKDESTEKIEIQKIDNANSNGYFQSLTDLIKSIKK